MFSAPHEEAQVRDGQHKTAEVGTGALALRAAALCGGSALATSGQQTGDPGWDDPHPFAAHAIQAARGGVLVDIHQMRPRGFDVCLGLGPDHQRARRLWLPVLERLLEDELTVFINWPFAARGRPIVGRAAREGILAVQVELSYELFDDDERIRALAEALAWAADRSLTTA